MPFGRVQMSGTPPIGGNPGNVMAEIARRWLQQRQAIQGGGQPAPGADAAMAQMLGLAGAPPISAGIEGTQPQQQMPGGLMGRIAAAPAGAKPMVRPALPIGSGVMRNAAMPIPASKPMVPRPGLGSGVMRGF